MSPWDSLNRKIWQKWREKYSLTLIVQEISQMTGWSEYYTLCYTVHFLHNNKKINFSKEQLRKAFKSIPEDDFSPECEQGSWNWVLFEAGLISETDLDS